MPSISYVVFKLLLRLCSLLCICQALELQEIRPRTPHSTRYGRSLAKRDFSVIDLKSTETFLWGAEGIVLSHCLRMTCLILSRWIGSYAWRVHR